jgi:hypothetical protein
MRGPMVGLTHEELPNSTEPPLAGLSVNGGVKPRQCAGVIVGHGLRTQETAGRPGSPAFAAIFRGVSAALSGGALRETIAVAVHLEDGK